MLWLWICGGCALCSESAWTTTVLKTQPETEPHATPGCPGAMGRWHGAVSKKMGFVLGPKSCISVILNVFMLFIEACGGYPAFILMVRQNPKTGK